MPCRSSRHRLRFAEFAIQTSLSSLRISPHHGKSKPSTAAELCMRRVPSCTRTAVTTPFFLRSSITTPNAFFPCHRAQTPTVMPLHTVAFIFNALPLTSSNTTSSVYTTAFVSPLRTAKWTHCLRYRNPTSTPVPLFVMRQYHRTPTGSRRAHTKSLSNITQAIQHTWRNASNNERFAIVVASLAAVTFAGSLLNAVFHISLFLAVAAVSLVAAPLMFLVLLSFTAFVVGVLMTTGFGFVIFGAPLFTAGLLAKMMLPVLALGAGFSFLATRLLGFRKGSSIATDPIADFDEEDEFDRFDDTLKTRVTGSRATNVEYWGLSEVVDELDFSGLGEYRQLFIEERIDGHALLNLSDEDIKAEFGSTMPLGDRMRLIRLVSKLRRRASSL